jgi:hypothetical protein
MDQEAMDGVGIKLVALQAIGVFVGILVGIFDTIDLVADALRLFDLLLGARGDQFEIGIEFVEQCFLSSLLRRNNSVFRIHPGTESSTIRIKRIALHTWLPIAAKTATRGQQSITLPD